MASPGPIRCLALLALVWSVTVGAAETSQPFGVGIEPLDWQLVGVYEHDPDAFTQGLVWHDGRLYESLGQYGDSALRIWDPENGLVEAEVRLDDSQFGEGLVLAGDELVQLTWKEGVVHRWSLPPFRSLGTWTIDGEGWGLAFDGEAFIQSDGTSRLVWRDRDSFAPVREAEVRRAGEPQGFLNELEWVDGVLYANVWDRDEILRIDPESGEVDGVLDLTGQLLPDEIRATVDVMNGIAYRPETDTFFLTGKYWPQLFEVQIVSRRSSDGQR